MKKVFFISVIVFCLFSITVNAQDEEKEEKKYGITFSGFVKNDFILDTRQTVSARDGHFLLYPANENLDNDNKDINDRASFNYLSIQSRLTGKITGPDAFGAKTSGMIEGAFFGQAEANINSFRLRHAFIKLDWGTTQLTLGQTWHTFFITGCYAGTVSFNTGVPFQFFSRNPQISISQKAGPLTFTGSVATQLDFQSPGGSEALRNALLPDMSGRIVFSPSDKLYTGVTLGYKQLMPRLETASGYMTTSTVGGIKAQAFLKAVAPAFTFKLQGIYAQNGFDGLMLGGYAIKRISDPVKDIREYTTLNVFSVWTEIHANTKRVQPGIFFAYMENLGASDDIEDITLLSIYSRGSNIASLYRVSPRLVFNSGKTRFALEVEHTGAAYGSSYDSKGVPQDTKTITNTRILVAAFYFF